MTLGALIGAGLETAWLEGLPERMGLSGVGVRVRDVFRASVRAVKVDFEIPGQAGHGRHVGELLALVEAAPVSEWVRERATRAFQLLGEAEGEVHGVEAQDVHLHEVGAVDALLDIVGAVEGFERLGVDAVFNLPVALGTGWVEAAHGQLPVPAPATALLLRGVEVSSGGPAVGEATTPTGAALLRVLSHGMPPDRWRMVQAGWGAGERDPRGYANALRLILAEAADEAAIMEVLVADLDDMPPEYLEPLREAAFAAGAVDCSVWATHGKKGRVAFRVEVLTPPATAGAVIDALFANSTTLGVRRLQSTRSTLSRREIPVEVAPNVVVRAKVSDGPGGPRLKLEFEDVVRAAAALNLPPLEVARMAERGAAASMALERQARK